MNVVLVSFRSDGARREVRLKTDRLLVGRLPDADLQIPVAAVSRRHCEISTAGGSLKIRDLGSSNGTFVNDLRITEATLSPGDRLTIGPATFVVQVDGVPRMITPDMAKASGAAARKPDSRADGSSMMDIPSGGVSGDSAALPVAPTRGATPAAGPTPGPGAAKPAAPLPAFVPLPVPGKTAQPAPEPATAQSEGDALSKMISKSKTDESSVFEFDFFDDDEDDDKR